MAALFAIPLAALGFAWLVKLGASLLEKMHLGRQGGSRLLCAGYGSGGVAGGLPVCACAFCIW